MIVVTSADLSGREAWLRPIVGVDSVAGVGEQHRRTPY